MQNAVSDIKIRLFADDTNLFLHDKDYKTLVSAANYNLNKLSEWLSVNKLSLNISKTCYCVFSKTSATSDVTVVTPDVNVVFLPALAWSKYT